MFGATAEKAAVADAEPLMVIVHGAVPEHHPPVHPLNVEPTMGVAVSVTVDP